jgi:hypothetical protein
MATFGKADPGNTNELLEMPIGFANHIFVKELDRISIASKEIDEPQDT